MYPLIPKIVFDLHQKVQQRITIDGLGGKEIPVLPRPITTRDEFGTHAPHT